MEWRDAAIVLSSRRHGEGAAIVSVLTANHGRHHGMVRGASGKQMRAVLQPGTVVACHWSARLEEHLGALRCEAVESSASGLLGDADRLAALASCCALADWSLPERHPCPALYDASLAFLVALQGDCWPAAYVHWEAMLLAECGFPLELDHCAVTGESTDLCYVSPKSGRAVCEAAGAPYRDRLLPLPRFLWDSATSLPEGIGAADIAAGYRLTGYFLRNRLEDMHNKALPAARGRLLERLERAASLGDTAGV